MMNFEILVELANFLFTVSNALPNSDVYEMLHTHEICGFQPDVI
jgi:hypothetical protein